MELLLQIVNQIESQYIINPVVKQDLFVKYLPLLSPIIVILTFFLNNIYNVKTKKKESKRNWYFKAYFEPNIKRVEEFFNQADSDMKAAVEAYQKSIKWSSDRRVEFISKTLAKFSDAKRKFLIEVVSLIMPAYPKECSDLENSLNEFEDACSDSFTNPPNPDAHFEFLKKITLIKGKIITILSKPAL